MRLAPSAEAATESAPTSTGSPAATAACSVGQPSGSTATVRNGDRRPDDATAYTPPIFTMSGPWAAIRRAFASGTVSGTNTVAGMLSQRAAVATPSPWLPPDAVTTPGGDEERE